MSSVSTVAVLYADIAGSTRLYEAHGDDAARASIAGCMDILSTITERFGGRVVKTIGDEVMCTFPDAARAVLAANEMQLQVRKASESGRFETGPLRIKVGAHQGPAVERGTEVFGEAAIIAQQVIKLAKENQILVSAETFRLLPPELKVGCRYFDKVEAEGREGELEIMEMIWEVHDVTQMADTQSLKALPVNTRLVLRYRGNEIELGEARTRLTIGRTNDNDLVLQTRLASRRHAEIEYRRGRFYYRDISSNGTIIVTEEGEANHVRGDAVQLHGRGKLSLGGVPDSNPGGIVEYECE
jgi:class 3 adenylate cyclase